MKFWDTFVNVWHVRNSIRIQNSIEETIRSVKENAETEVNLPQIIAEVTNKNAVWEEKLNHFREKREE